MYTSSRQCLKDWINDAVVTVDFLHVVLTPESVRHVSFLSKRLVGLFVKTLVKSRIPSCARENRERLTRLQCEELAVPAEDDEQIDELVDELGDEHVKELVELRREQQLEQDLHAEVMLRRVHANLVHPSIGLMSRLLCDANQCSQRFSLSPL